MSIKNHILQSILSSNKKVFDHKWTFDPIILVPLICGAILVIILLLFICCTKHVEHESDADDILELSTIEPNHCITHGSTEESHEDRSYYWLQRKQSLSPIPELYECNDELSIN